MNYQFSINGTVISDPLSWDEVTLSFEADEKGYFKTLAETLTICEKSVYDDLLDLCQATPCAKIPLTIEFRCHETAEWEDFQTLLIDVKKLKFSCPKCKVDVDTRNVGLALLLEDADNEICVGTTRIARNFEFESGSEFSEFRNWITISELVNELVGELSGDNYTVCSDLLTQPYQQECWQIPIPSGLAPGETATLIVEMPFHRRAIEVSGLLGIDGLGTALRNSLLYYDGYVGELPDTWRFLTDVACAEWDGGDNILTIYSFYPLNSPPELIINGTPAPATLVQPFQYGLADLVVSPKGFDGNQVCMSLECVLDLLYAVSGAKYELQGDCMVIEKPEAFEPVLPPAVEKDCVDMTFGKDPEWLVGAINLEDDNWEKSVQETRDQWIWESERENIGALADGGQTILSPSNLLFPIETQDPSNSLNADQLTISGFAREVRIEITLFQQPTNPLPGTQTVTIRKSDSGGLIVGSVSSTNGRFIFDTICLEPGTYNFEWSTTGAIPPGSTWGPTSSIEIEFVPCGSAEGFETKFDTLETRMCNDPEKPVPFFETKIHNCPDTKDIGIDSKFYPGIGLAVSQHEKGITTYDDTHFLAFWDTFLPGSGQLQQFTKCAFWIDHGCACTNNFLTPLLDTRLSEYNFYNIPLIAPMKLLCWMQRIPYQVWPPYWYSNVTYDGDSNEYTYNEAQPDGYQPTPLQPLHARDCIAEFTTCLSVPETRDICEEKGIGFSCEGGAGPWLGEVTSFSRQLKGGQAAITVKFDCNNEGAELPITDNPYQCDGECLIRFESLTSVQECDADGKIRVFFTLYYENPPMTGSIIVQGSGDDVQIGSPISGTPSGDGFIQNFTALLNGTGLEEQVIFYFNADTYGYCRGETFIQTQNCG